MRLLLLLALPAAFATPALTASTGVPGGGAGAGTGAIGGYAVSEIAYELDGETIAAVTFALAPARVRTVKARLAPGKPWTRCTVAAGTATCPVATSLQSAAALDVVAAG